MRDINLKVTSKYCTIGRLRILEYPDAEGGGILLSEEMKGYLALAAACTGGMAVLLAPTSIVTLGLGVALGYKGKDYIGNLLEGGGQK